MFMWIVVLNNINDSTAINTSNISLMKFNEDYSWVEIWFIGDEEPIVILGDEARSFVSQMINVFKGKS